MAYETRDELRARLAKVDAALDAARNAESYGIGSRNLRRNMAELRRERKEIIEQIEYIDSVGNGGMFNKVKFVRPV